MAPMKVSQVMMLFSLACFGLPAAGHRFMHTLLSKGPDSAAENTEVAPADEAVEPTANMGVEMETASLGGSQRRGSFRKGLAWFGNKVKAVKADMKGGAQKAQDKESMGDASNAAKFGAWGAKALGGAKKGLKKGKKMAAAGMEEAGGGSWLDNILGLGMSEEEKFQRELNGEGGPPPIPDAANGAYSVQHVDGVCSGTMFKAQSGIVDDINACAAKCTNESGCHFIAFCPAGRPGCHGQTNENRCELFSTCTSKMNRKGFTAYHKEPKPKDPNWWKAELQKQEKNKADKLKRCKPCNGQKVDQRFGELVCRSEIASFKIPSDANQLKKACKNTGLQKSLARHAKYTWPIVHPRVEALVDQFLTHKQANGTSVEKDVYASMTVRDMYTRFFEKRPLMFMTAVDAYLLRDGQKAGQGGFDSIGTNSERWPLKLIQYQSYPEMEISALLGISTSTQFINNGARNNVGHPGSKGSFESEGVILGVVGARFERVDHMEWRHMIVTQSQNTESKGYGKDGDAMLKSWAQVYGVDSFPTYEEALAHRGKNRESRFAEGSGAKGQLKKGQFFDKAMYKARCEITAELTLAEANERAKTRNRKAFVHLVGLGLGVWKLHDSQQPIQANSYITAIRKLSLPDVGSVTFAWFGRCSLGSFCNSKTVKDKDGHSITVEFKNRHQSAKTPSTRSGEKQWLLVAQYAWDGNSYPGNEYWMGKKYFEMSGDPAAACSSYIPELQNPLVNIEAFHGDQVKVLPDEGGNTSYRAALLGSQPKLSKRKQNRTGRKRRSQQEPSDSTEKQRQRRTGSKRRVAGSLRRGKRDSVDSAGRELKRRGSRKGSTRKGQHKANVRPGSTRLDIQAVPLPGSPANQQLAAVTPSGSQRRGSQRRGSKRRQSSKRQSAVVAAAQ